MHFLQAHKEKIIEMVAACIHLIGGEIEECVYKNQEKKGLYFRIALLKNRKILKWVYFEEKCHDWQTFLNTLNTDIALNILDVQHDILKLIKITGKNKNVYISYSNKCFKGYEGLDRFWDANTLQFDWGEFKKFVAEKNRQYLEKIDLRRASINLFSPIDEMSLLPTGKMSMLLVQETEGQTETLIASFVQHAEDLKQYFKKELAEQEIKKEQPRVPCCALHPGYI
ncbi:MAG TPA: hypothetical protein VHZ76_02435 [Gammaproteobacteria bacterium]|nr:hypothetical protein [Gammaproteobacteria bacterium]